MDKKLYKYLKEVLEQPDGSSKKEQITGFREEMLYAFSELFADCGEQELREKLKKELHFSRWFQTLLKGNADSGTSFEAGTISGIIMAMEAVSNRLTAKSRTDAAIAEAVKEKTGRDILLYLYSHPGSLNETIAAEFGMNPDSLDLQIQKLEEAGAVVRYGAGQRCFYELTLDGQAAVNNPHLHFT